MTNNFRVSDDAEDAEWFVAVRKTEPLILPDNLIGHCSKCWHMIQFRPDVPRHLKKVCFDCATPQMNRAFKRGELELRTLPQHMAEYVNYIKKKHAN